VPCDKKRIRFNLLEETETFLDSREEGAITAQHRNTMRRPSGMQIIAAAACVGTIVLAGLALLFLQTPGGKIMPSSPANNAALATQTAEVSQVQMRSAPEQLSVARDPPFTPASRTVRAQVSIESIGPTTAHAEGGLPAEERIVPSASPVDPLTPASALQTNSASLRPNDTHPDIVTLDRSGVNIRSAPSVSSRVVGSAPKGARFEVTSRHGRWVEIRSDDIKGWVSGSFLEPPQRR
jgi:hypothetical protein